jgi:predicted Zn-ribbon and HTH transcriptional regulator
MEKQEIRKENGVSTPEKLECIRCGHIWFSNLGRRPSVCPRCKSYEWDQPFKRKSKRRVQQ